ncbi:unnamed protein product [Allacma fusca]|uniref:C3H1-type domain-containing protein n=1 Tax=Allacma fusca TaxID=39272 RepID=A0A8J2PLB3_9HEXA|nr:unnamed protein product [Allacma fusca]
MDADSSTGLNDNSESGECDSPSADENTSNTVDFDSASKLSATSERTNIDALDDTARDTLIVPPAEDSSHSIKSLKHNSGRVDLSGDHDVLDFEGDELEDNVRGKLLNNDADDDEDEEGELEDEKECVDSASPVQGLEEGECVEDRPVVKPIRKKIVYKESEKDEGEDDELEEGEVTDDEDRNNKDPKPVCRFFGKGQCTWGSNCRFLHPGVTDKGLYTMFDPMRPLLPIPNNPATSTVKPGLLGIAPPNFPPIVKTEEPVIESAWERGLRNAKEIIKQSVKRKETDIDFEEKKMNLTLAQEEIDKENDYYVRKPASPEPVVDPPEEDPYIDNYEAPGTWAGPPNVPPPIVRHTVAPQKIDPDFVRERVHRLHNKGRQIREAPPRDAPIREAPPLHEPEVRMVRESALRRSHKFPDQYGSGAPHGSRRNYDDPRKAEEWHDPWMRTKSPGGRVSRKDSTVSKRSSYSSGSSRSSSRSSSSSKSSRSSRSSSKSSKSSRGSNSPATKKRRKSRDEVVRKAPPRRMSPKPVRIAPPPPPKEEFGRRVAGYGPAHYDRPPRFAPSPPKMPGHVKDRNIPEKNNPSQTLVRERDLKGGRGGNRMRHRSNWSARSESTSRSRSRSVSRSRSRSPWSKSLSKSHSKSRSRSISSKPRTRSKFSRDRSISRSPSPSRSRSITRRHSSSRSRSPSSSSSSSSSLGSPTLTRTKRKAPSVEKTLPTLENAASEVHLPPKQPHKKAEVGKVQATAPVKPQIKMTLKSSSGIKANKNVLDRLSDDFKDDKAREAQAARDGNRTPIPDEDSSREILSVDEVSNGAKGSTSPKEVKSSSKRREELLKQLKAVEDAIAKKRSKILISIIANFKLKAAYRCVCS